MTILIISGASFIGASFVLDWLARSRSDEPIINLDKLAYAGNFEAPSPLQGDVRYSLADLNKFYIAKF